MRWSRQTLLPVPAQALGLLLLVVVLAAVLVSAPLMTASSGQGAWEQREGQLSPTVLGLSLLSSTISPTGADPAGRLDTVTDLDAAIRAQGDAAGLAGALTLTRLTEDAGASGPTGSSGAQVVSRTGAADAVDVVAGSVSDSGVLVPQQLADAVGAGPGRTLTVSGPDGEVDLQVSGVYADVTAPLPAYWDGQGYLFLSRTDPATGEVLAPPPVVLAGQDVAVGAARGIGSDLFLEWFFPTPPAELARARAAARAGERLQLQVVAPEGPVAGLVQDAGFQQPVGRSSLPTVLSAVDSTVALLSPPVRAVGAGGALAALVLVGAWAGLRARRREGELRALVARGLSPARGGLEAAGEALLPVLAGLLVGGAAGWGAVVALGPSPRLPDTVLPTVLATLLVAGVVAVGVVATVSASAVARLGRVGQGPAAQLLGRVPWLPVLAAVTVVVALPLVLPDRGGSGAASAPGGTTTAGGAGQVDLLALVVPLMAVVVVAGAVVAGLQRFAPRLASRVRRLPTPVFLAVRRVLAGPGATRLVVVTTALSLGLVVYAGALADSTARTVAAKASVATGSDVVVSLRQGQQAPGPALTGQDGGLPAAAMEVGSKRRVELAPGEVTADVLVVRPDQIPGVVRWDPSLADQTLEELMGALTGYTGDRVPVVAAGPLPEQVVDAVDGQVTVDLGGYSIPVQVVARVEAFPGQSSRAPLLVAAWDPYVAAVQAADRDPASTLGRQVWARGDAATVLDDLAAIGLGPSDPERDVATAQEFQTRPELVAQTWTLGYLRAVALAAGLLGLVGLVLHAVSAQRQRTVAALLLTRMGLSRRAADTTTGLEVGLLAALGALVAVAVAVPASALVLGLLDPVPSLPPDPLVAVPWSSIVAAAVGVAGATVVAAAIAGRSARRSHGGQVLRDAD